MTVESAADQAHLHLSSALTCLRHGVFTNESHGVKREIHAQDDLINNHDDLMRYDKVSDQ